MIIDSKHITVFIIQYINHQYQILFMKNHTVSNESQLVIQNELENTLTLKTHPISDSKTIEISIKKSNNQQEKEKEQQVVSISSNLAENKIPRAMKSFLKQKRIVSEISLNQSKLTFQMINSQIKNKIYPNQTNQSIIQLQLQNIPQLQHITKSSKQKQIKNTCPTIHSEISSQCSICEGKIEMKNKKYPVFHCSHVFCLDCTKNYIIYKINRFQEIYCPNQNCKEALNQKSNFYSNEVPLKERKKYRRIHNFYQVHNRNQLQKICPNSECEGVLEIDPNKPLVSCKICGNQFCSKCLALAHSGQCEDFQTMFLKENFNLVKCQKCKNYIEKEQGCHHITCKCGYQFCEKCKKQWSKRHICKYSILNRASQGWGGCDWGITKKDHIYFMLKIPLKVILIILCVTFWTLFSFLGTPLNIVIGIYWLYLLLIKPSIDMILSQNQIWKVLVFLVLFPFLMVWNLCTGKQELIAHLDRLLPEIPNSFRWIIRI